MEIYKDHEKEFSKCISNANRKLAMLSSEESGDYILNDTKQSLDEAGRLVSMMENDLRGLGSHEASQLQGRFQRHKENLANLRQQLASARNKKDKDELFASGQNAQREKMLTNNQILQETGDVLDSANRIAVETEALGNDTVHALKKQRKQIQDIGEKVNDVGANVTRADRLVLTMNNRRICIKLIMMLTILLLTIAFGIVLYIKVG
jgi:uncharacterized protein involved in exopolysaccharide biosynthesis